MSNFYLAMIFVKLILVSEDIFSALNSLTPKWKLARHPSQKSTLTWHTKIGGWQSASPVCAMGQLSKLTNYLSGPNLLAKSRSDMCLTLPFYKFITKGYQKIWQSKQLPHLALTASQYLLHLRTHLTHTCHEWESCLQWTKVDRTICLLQTPQPPSIVLDWQSNCPLLEWKTVQSRHWDPECHSPSLPPPEE